MNLLVYKKNDPYENEGATGRGKSSNGDLLAPPGGETSQVLFKRLANRG